LSLACALALSGAAAVLSLVLTPPVGRAGLRLGFADQPGPRRVSDRPIPTTGGIVVFLAFGIAMAAGLRLCHDLPTGLPHRLAVLLTGTACIAVLGAIDDKVNLSPLAKLVVQSAVAAGVTANGFAVSEMRFLMGPTLHIGWLGYPLVFLWFLTFTNALNLIDGLDGLAGGIAAIASASLVTLSIVKGNAVLLYTAAALLGSIGGFLFHNFSRGCVYLGDAGSTGLGFLMAGVAIIGSANDAASSSILVAAACMAVPLFDVATSVIRRWRAGVNIFACDRGHIHHRLIRFGLGPRRVVFVLWGVTVFFAGQILGMTATRGVFYTVASLASAAAAGWIVVRQRRKNVRTTGRTASDDVFYLMGTRDLACETGSSDEPELRDMIANRALREQRYRRLRAQRRAAREGAGSAAADSNTLVAPTIPGGDQLEGGGDA
jgi:UDP-GlcNAc:undecaprenyl-phosphate GlcNAc-1-phosphate transferase